MNLPPKVITFIIGIAVINYLIYCYFTSIWDIWGSEDNIKLAAFRYYTGFLP